MKLGVNEDEPNCAAIAQSSADFQIGLFLAVCREVALLQITLVLGIPLADIYECLCASVGLTLVLEEVLTMNSMTASSYSTTAKNIIPLHSQRNVRQTIR